MDENPYKSPGVPSDAVKHSWRRFAWPITAGVFFCLWLRAEYALSQVRYGWEAKDKAVIEWANHDPEFRRFLSDRMSGD